jgi:hypothetical protein
MLLPNIPSLQFNPLPTSRSLFRRTVIRNAVETSYTATRYVTLLSMNPSRRSLSSTPVTVPVTPEEVAARKLGWHNLEMATRALHRDGLVVLQDVIEHSKLDALNKTMVRDALKLQALGDAGPFNYNKGCVSSSRRGYYR